MKKLKVILPAILTLAVSTSAAVTGTVAWFTATRLRQVDMKQITVVNPEEGLNLKKAKNVANTKITGEGIDAETGVLSNKNTVPTIIHANDGTNQGVLRDASVNLSSTATVYRSVLGDTGNITAFESIGSDFTVKDPKKYNNKDIYYVTQFKLSFDIDRTDENLETLLFFDANASSTAAISAVTDGANTNLAYRSLRIGFKTSANWIVWAPLTADTAAATNESAEPKVYAPRVVTGTGISNVADVSSDHLIKGNETGVGTDSKFTETNGKLPANAATAKAYTEYLGVLKDDAELDVDVFTWFEGTDTSCENENFQSLVSTMTANLRFISRKVA